MSDEQPRQVWCTTTRQKGAGKTFNLAVRHCSLRARRKSTATATAPQVLADGAASTREMLGALSAPKA